MPERFISIEDSLYVGNNDDAKRMLNEEKELLLFLSRCILKRKAVQIRYRPHFLKDETEPDILTFHPEYLRRIGRKWMVYGMSYSQYFAQRGQREYIYVNLILSRIESIEESAETYIYSGVDYSDDPFKDQMTYHSLGARNMPKTKVVLKVKKYKAPLNESKVPIYPFERIKQEPLHHSQRVIDENENFGYISLEVTDAHLITPLLLMWGADIEVLQPSQLRQKMASEIERMYNNYKQHNTNDLETVNQHKQPINTGQQEIETD